MNKQRLVKLLSLIVMLAGIMVMLGWILDISILKSILLGWVTMKFSTALSFVLSGIILYLIAMSLESGSGVAQVFLPVAVLIILLIMLSHLVAAFLGLRLGIEELFIKEAKGTVRSVMPGRPSVPTMVSFVLIAAAGMLTMLNLANLKSKLRFLGWIIMIIGMVAVLGYVVNAPLLYYYIEGKNAAMAFHTAILFALIGISLIFLGGKK